LITEIDHEHVQGKEKERWGRSRADAKDSLKQEKGSIE
jgi:hypothetical protein